MERKTLIIICAVGGVFLVIVMGVLISISTSERVDDFALPDRLEASQCTRDFDPLPLIIVSLDGFHPKYLKRGVTPTINKIIEKGTSAPFMAPSFPSVTFPNHYTVVTGLYPESHGIVDNKFYDPVFKTHFSYKNAESKKGRWWGGEPIWNTVRKHNLLSATYYWPGSEAPIQSHRPHYYKSYTQKIPLNQRAQEVIKWLELPKQKRPSLITLYSHEPDKAGHGYGPYSDQVTAQLVKVDSMIKYLLKALKDRDLLPCVNILVTSDHGMAATGEEKVIHLDKYIPKNLQDQIDFTGGAFGRISMKKRDQNTTQLLEESLTCQRREFQLFRRDELPKRFHYSNNRRIGDYIILLRNGFTVNFNTNFYLKGVHGFDNHFPSMNALFVAYGPAFKENYQTKPFQNIELYNLMCTLLNITPAPNNGTQGLLNGILKDPPQLNLTEQSSHKYGRGTVATLDENWRENIKESNCEWTENLDELWAQSLNMNEEDRERVELEISPWGIPESDRQADNNLRLLYHHDYISGYSPITKLPVWTAFLVDKIPEEFSPNEPNWIPDPRLTNEASPSCGPTEDSFTLSPLFRPEFARNESTKFVSNLISNGAPISHQLKGHWNDLMTKLVPKWFNESQSLLNIIVGPIFDHDGDGLADIHDNAKENTSVIPTDYFAIVTKCSSQVDNLRVCPENQLHSLAFIYPQKLSIKMCDVNEFEYAQLFNAKIREIQKLTRLKFFSKLGQPRRFEILSNEYYNLW